jgi:glyoxylase-like metal-dependent hydrolase (beta-lactamase superfamily II)
MLIETAAAPPFMKNGFVVACERTQEAIYIDPGDEVAQLLAHTERERLRVVAILLTHAHVDHVSGVAAGPRARGAPLWVHPQGGIR